MLGKPGIVPGQKSASGFWEIGTVHLELADLRRNPVAGSAPHEFRPYVALMGRLSLRGLAGKLSVSFRLSRPRRP